MEHDIGRYLELNESYNITLLLDDILFELKKNKNYINSLSYNYKGNSGDSKIILRFKKPLKPNNFWTCYDSICVERQSSQDTFIILKPVSYKFNDVFLELSKISKSLFVTLTIYDNNNNIIRSENTKYPQLGSF